MGLRFKLGASLGVLLAAVFAVYGVFTLQSEREIFLQGMEHRGVALLRSLAIPAAVAMADHDASTLDHYIVEFRDAAADLDLKYLAVLDDSGTAIAHTDSTAVGKRYRDPFAHAAIGDDEPITWEMQDAEEPLLVVSAPVTGAARLGTLRAGFTLTEVNTAIARSRRTVILVALLLAVVSTVIAYLVFSVLVINPVFRMRSMAARFGRGELDARVTLFQDDEVGQLGRALNGMAQQIQDYTASLEHQVDQRTEELASTNTRLVEANEQLQRLAKTDSLTGLYNRRYFMEQLEMEVQRGERIHHQFTVILLDVDHFKNYNDRNGHTEGDELLQRLAALLQVNTRSTDVVARYGGEEFVILLLGTGLNEGFATARKIQQAVAAQPFPHEDKQPGERLTISVGVAFYPHDSRDGRALVQCADEALYRSKAQGRNRVTRFDQMKDVKTRSVGGPPSSLRRRA